MDFSYLGSNPRIQKPFLTLTLLPTTFLATLDDEARAICFRASLICYSVTRGTQVPREMQLRAVLADQTEQDSLVAAGTGSGKTLPMALNILLDDPSKKLTTVTISPLKRLQATQENDFNTRYSIPTVVINEDTPREDEWWKVSTCTSTLRFWSGFYTTYCRKMSTMERHVPLELQGISLSPLSNCSSRVKVIFPASSCCCVTSGSQS